MAEVVVDLTVSDNQVAAEANKASAGMAKLAAQEELVKKTAAALGVEVGEVRKALALQERDAKAAALAAKKAADQKTAELLKAKALEAKQQAQDKLDAAKAAKAKALAEKKALQEAEKARKKAEAAAKSAHQATLKQAKGVKDILGGNVLEAAEKFPLVAVAAAGVGVAIVAATVAATALLVKIGEMAVAAGGAKQSAQSMLDVLTGGRGAQALQLLDGLADQLGIKFETARDRFIKFRQAGLDNKLSTNLLKLTSDLDAMDPSGKLANEAIEKALSHKNKDGTLDIKAAKEEMALLAKQAKITGDGTKSAAAKLTTWTGALNSLDNTKTKALEQIFERIGPSIGAAAGKVAVFVDQFLKSEKGQRAIDMIGKGILAITDGVIAATPFVLAIFDGLVRGADNALKILGPVGDVISHAFGGDKTAAIQAVATTVSVMTTAVVLATAAFGALVTGATAVAAAMALPVTWVIMATQALQDLGAAAYEGGKNIVQGLINGITGGEGSLYAKMQNMASQAWQSFKSTLGIASPSKKFQFGGQMVGKGVEKGVDQSMPSAVQATSEALEAVNVASGSLAGLPGASSAGPSLPGPSAPGRAAPAAAAGGAGGPALLIENLHFHGGSGSPEENAQSLRRQLQEYATAMQVSRGR